VDDAALGFHHLGTTRGTNNVEHGSTHERKSMRKYLFLFAALALGSLSAIGPASAATNQGKALELCAQNTNCSWIRMNDGVNLNVGPREIWCPNYGPCVLLNRTSSGAAGSTSLWGLPFKITKSVIPAVPGSLISSGGNDDNSNTSVPPSGDTPPPAGETPGQIN
jgi:hypothetical protein